jgi:hypothetical protein
MHHPLQSAQAYRGWVLSTSIGFGIAGLLALLITDLIFLPRAPSSSLRLRFSTEPMLLVSTSVPPALFAWYASLRWLRNGSKFFRGWLSVAVFAWVSLVINPIIWLLVVATFTLYGWVVLTCFLAAGLLFQVAWRMSGRSTR